MRKSLFTIITGTLLIFGCDVISTDISISYPFDKDKPEEYAISIDDAMTNLDNAITSQTETLVNLKVDKSMYPEGANVTVNTTLSLDNILLFLGGKDATVGISVTVTHSSLPQPLTETQNITFSICDFVKYKTQGVSTTFDFAGVHMEIMNLDTYCPNKVGTAPYLFITHRTTPKPIALSENKQLKSYKSYLNKIQSATLDDLKLTITEPLAGITFGEDTGDGSTNLSMSASLFAQPVDCETNADGSYKQDANGDPICTGIDFSEERNPADFYVDIPKWTATTTYAIDALVEYEGNVYRSLLAGNNNNKPGETPTAWESDVHPYWIGDFANSALTEGGVLKLVYTYDGKSILQKSIKNLDFQIGIKSWYKIKPGSTRPSGILKASVSATFFFSVVPLR